MTARALAHRMIPANGEIFAGSIVHCSRRVVHRACDHSGKRKFQVMVGRDVVRALVMFHSVDALVGHSVRVFALKPCRLECSVIIYQKMSFAALPRDVFIEVDHILVLHLHKVYLDA